MEPNEERVKLITEIRQYDKELWSFNFDVLDMEELRKLHKIVMVSSGK